MDNAKTRNSYHPPEYIQEILEKMYYQPGEDWGALCLRVATAIASVEATPELQKKWQEIFFEHISSGKLLPNTPAFVNLGTNQLGCAAACFALRPEDSMDSIMETARLTAMILKYGGGVGFELSALRPNGTPIQSTHKQAMGPVGVMKHYNSVGNLVTQGGVRKAALIAILKIDHPDIIKFITAKEKDGDLANFNISVSVPDSFMKRLSTGPDKPFLASFGGKQYHLLSNGEPVLKADRGSNEVLSVRAVWERICQNATENGDPGIFFVDTANRDNVLIANLSDTSNPYYIHGTNPCLTGDQKVYVITDRRGPVDLKTLAEEGQDVSVLTVRQDGTPAVEVLRNPRLTGWNQKILKIIMTDGTVLRCTENHKIILEDGSPIRADEVAPGTRLRHITRREEPNSAGTNRYAMLYANGAGRVGEHRFIAEHLLRRPLEPNEVVHHKNYDGLDNSLENLEIMTKVRHDNLHREDRLGDKNPMRRFPEKNWLVKQDWSSEKNPRYINISNEEYFNAAVEVSTKAERVLSKREWQKICKEAGLPIGSRFRFSTLGFRTPSNLLMAAAEEAGVFRDRQRMECYRHYLNLRESYDLPVEFSIDEGILIVKQCEYCKREFRARWGSRETCYCSVSCGNKGKQPSMEEGRKYRAETAQKETRQNQILAYYDLQQELGRDPLLREWSEHCKREGIPYRLRRGSQGNRYCFRRFSEVKEAAAGYTNFKVLSVEEDGFENVYNGTVGNTHHLCVVLEDQEHQPGLKKTKLLDTLNCGEIPLIPREACLLASIDLAKFVRGEEGADGTIIYSVDIPGLKEVFSVATRLLDDMIDATPWPDPQIEEKVKASRRIGVGVMGYASLLDKIGIRYGSDEAIQIAEEIAKVRLEACKETSLALGEEKGIFPAAREGNKHRNTAVTTVAPTGTVAMVADTSWSIEPHMYWAFRERRAGNDRIRFLPAVEREITQEELQDLSDQARDLEHLNSLIEEKLPSHMVLGQDVPWERQILTNAAWQRYTDNAISKTINLPQSDLTPEVVSDIYRRAWEEKLKGVTVYPFGSRSGEPMSIQKKKTKEIKLPEELPCVRHKYSVVLDGNQVKTYCFVSCYPDMDTPVEVFLKHPHIGDLTTIQFVDLTTRLISLALRYRYCMHCDEEAIPIGELVKQLRETDGQSMRAVPSIFVSALSKYLTKEDIVGNCPSCGQSIIIIEGCELCRSCGWRACF